MERRPRVFIGSSTEGQEVARALQQELAELCEVELWNQGVFGLGGGTLESLVNSLDKFDFAVLAVTADDLRDKRGVVGPVPRDNVVFEAGLFIAGLGQARTFIVYDSTANIGLPSDLAGITHAPFRPDSTGNVRAAVGPASTDIRNAIRVAGPRELDLRRTVEAVQDTVNASGETGPEEQVYFDKLAQIMEGGERATVALLYADIDGLRSITRQIFLDERDRSVPGRRLGRRPEAEIREEFLLALSIALTDAVYEVRPAGLKHDIFRLPDPDVVLVGRELPYDDARNVAIAAQQVFRKELVQLWPAAEQRDSGLTVLVANAVRAAELQGGASLLQMHQLLRRRLKQLKDSSGRGKVYGHDDLTAAGA